MGNNAANAVRDAFVAHYTPLCEFVARYIRSRAIAEEIVQDVFLRLWTSDSKGGVPMLDKTYLYKAARNGALQYLRRERLITKHESVAVHSTSSQTPARTPVDIILDADASMALERAIEQLPERCRLVFILRREKGLKYTEIAERLNMSVSTVETHMWRALNQLKQTLEPYLKL